MSQKPLSELNACSKEEFVAALANIFEYSPWIAEQAAAGRPYKGVTPLFEAMKTAVDRAAPELRLALIKAHPDLADKTYVELEHRLFERFGTEGEKIRSAVDSPDGWAGLLKMYGEHAQA